LAKGRGYVMGSEPPQDPLAEVSQSTLTVTSTDDIRWNNRAIKDSWIPATGIALAAIISVLIVPQLVIIITAIGAIFIYSFAGYMGSREGVDAQSGWIKRELSDLHLVEEEKSLRRVTGEKFSVTGLTLEKASPKLSGSIASLVRAVPSSDGLMLDITMKPGVARRVIDDHNLTDTLERYLSSESKSEIETYLDYRAGLWQVGVSYYGLVRDANDLRFHESAIKGSIPARGWKKLSPSDVTRKLSGLVGGKSHLSFYAVGKELAEWLVQLRSELASEVGTNVPGQFVVDIRARAADLPLGVVINPDTLMSGPTTGLSTDDISKGVLICGGNHENRLHVLSLIVRNLIETGKRVMIISSKPETLQLVGHHDAGVGFVLGRDFVLNPVDAESVSRNEYVSKLLRALETLADKSLTSAAKLEVALGRAVAIPNSTIVDVRFDESTDSITDDAIVKTDVHPVKLSLWGMEAIRKLHEGSGARAFYGTQTAKMSLLSSLPLSIIIADLGSIPLDVFATDLLMIKLSGLSKTKDLVVVLDDPDGLRIANSSYSRRELWIDSLARELSDIVSLVVCIDQPHMLSSGVKNALSSCISLRLRDEKDIATVSSRLALSVIGTGLHSKARWSARETSFLRTMNDDIALLVHDEVETAQPIKLALLPPTLELSQDEVHERNGHILKARGFEPLGTGISGSGSNLRLNDELTIKVLRLLERYEPLTEEAMRRFILATGQDGDVEGTLIRLKESSLILEGYESHSGVSYKNYRLTMKGTMALNKVNKEEFTTK
jgi:hypothetical protein